MTARIEKKGAVWTVIHSRPEARNAMDPQNVRQGQARQLLRPIGADIYEHSFS
jgi:hypothetical protein